MRSAARRQEPAVRSAAERSGLVLIAEDEVNARRGLAEFLELRGFMVKRARNGREAVTLAEKFQPDAVVMDIQMPGEIDGVEAACQIQLANPDVAIVFVTAYATELKYHQRVEKAQLRVARWIEKPLLDGREVLLIDTLRREGRKPRIRAAMAEAQARGKELEDFRLEDLEPDLPELIAEVRVELRARYVLQLHPGESGMRSASTRIDSLYTEIRTLVARSATDPSVRGQIEARRKELRQLQEQEAAELGRRYEASLGFKPRAVLEILARAKKALGDA